MAIFQPTISGGGGSAPAHYIEKTVNASGSLQSKPTEFIDLTGVTGLSSYILAYAYWEDTNLSGDIVFPDLLTISGGSALLECFYSATKITGIKFPHLTTISGNSACQGMCLSCVNLVNVEFPSLVTVSSMLALKEAFRDTKVVTVSFPSLSTLTGQQCLSQCFSACRSLISVWFYALTPSSFDTRTNQFSNMLQGLSNKTVHFPMAIQSTIGSWSDVTNGFGGTNTTVLFDIVTSLTGADTNTYTRKQKESTQTATAWTYNDTLYYTSGTTEPSVGDTIYSDSSCTTAVTTISAIA